MEFLPASHYKVQELQQDALAFLLITTDHMWIADFKHMVTFVKNDHDMTASTVTTITTTYSQFENLHRQAGNVHRAII